MSTPKSITKEYIFSSKIGWEIIVPMTCILSATSILSIMDGVYSIVFVNVLVLVFIVHLFASTRYTVSGETLHVQSGFFFKKDIKISDIRKITEERSFISAPATSTDRLSVRIGKYDDVYISPKDKAAFVACLQAHNPAIEAFWRNK